MGELTHLARELDELSDTGRVETGVTGDHVVKFSSRTGEYNHLTSRIITALSSYDANVYESNLPDFQWIAVANKE